LEQFKFGHRRVWPTTNLFRLVEPSKNLPRAVVIGPGIVIVAYLLTNVAYYAVLDASVIKTSQHIAMDFGQKAFGHAGSIIIPLAVVGSTFSAANAGVFTGARVVYVSARSGHAPLLLGVVNARTGKAFHFINRNTNQCYCAASGHFYSLCYGNLLNTSILVWKL
jgi:amino acid transporter